MYYSTDISRRKYILSLYNTYMVGLLCSIQKFDFEGDKGGVYPTVSADSTAYHCK